MLTPSASCTGATSPRFTRSCGVGPRRESRASSRPRLSLGRFRDEMDGSALPWLYGVARNLLRTFHERERIESKARQRLGLPARDYELEVHEANARVDAERLAPGLSAALATLPPTQRQALQLRVIEELPYRQVALSLHCSEVAARIRVTRAIDSLS